MISKYMDLTDYSVKNNYCLAASNNLNILDWNFWHVGTPWGDANKLLTLFGYNKVIINVSAAHILFPDHLDVNSCSKSSIYTEFFKVYGFINLSSSMSSY